MVIQDESEMQNNSELIREKGCFNPFFEVTNCDLKELLSLDSSNLPFEVPIWNLKDFFYLYKRVF